MISVSRQGTVEGAVLCGGESRRMGTDKAALRPPGLGGRSLLENALEVLDGVAPRVVLGCGPRPRYAGLGRELVLDEVGGRGPLAGLAAVLGALRGEWLCVLACDMPRARPEVFAALLERAREAELDACLLETPAGLEPLYAVYRWTCGEPARRALAAGEGRLVAFHGGLAVGRLACDGAGERATNLNTPADLEREAARTGARGGSR